MVKAIRIHQTGGPEVMQFETIELPPPGEGQVRVKHMAIGVNFIDTYHRSGLYKLPLPAGIGSEAAGIVEAIGPNAGTALKPGDRVAYAMVPGAYAEAANVPAWRVVKVPEGVSDETAAASLLKGLTAQYLLKRLYTVRPGQTILVHAAAGATGQIICQWANHLGAIVIGTAGSEAKMELARANGCQHVLNSRTDAIAKTVRELTGGVGVPVVYDGVGKESFESSLDSLQVRGLMVCFGNASGPVPPLDIHTLTHKGSLFLTRPTLASYTRSAEEIGEAAADLFSVILSGAVKIAIHQRFALDQARAAHEALQARATTGATVLIP